MKEEHKTRITPEKSIKHEIAETIVKHYESLLSALSWACFKEQGRGYLFLHREIDVEHIAGNNFEIQEKPPILRQDIFYFAKGGEAWNNAKESEAMSGQTKEMEKFYEIVDIYNPRNEFLIVIGLNQGERATEHWFRREPEKPPYKTRVR